MEFPGPGSLDLLEPVGVKALIGLVVNLIYDTKVSCLLKYRFFFILRHLKIINTRLNYFYLPGLSFHPNRPNLPDMGKPEEAFL